MFFIGTGIVGMVLLIPMLFIMFSRNGWRYMIPMMWIILAVDILCGSFLFAIIQGALIWYAYSHRRLPPNPADPGQLPGDLGGPPPGLPGHPLGCQCDPCIQRRSARQGPTPSNGRQLTTDDVERYYGPNSTNLLRSSKVARL